ncbi:MAG: alpha/beta hydrolase [Candidatus Humimicrobiaceae bacterium]
MKEQSFFLKRGSETDIYVNSWVPDKIRAAVLIIHGMAEHSARYRDFSKFLAENNFAAYGYDLRGHGKTAGDPDKVGFISGKGEWDKLLNDLHELKKHISLKHKNRPIFLFGHSMGSFLARNYAYLTKSKLDGIILSGNIGPQGIMGYAGLLLAKIEELIKGPDAKSHLLHNLTFGNYARHFKERRTEFDWLSSKKEAVDRYIKDPYCGSIFSASFFCDLLKAVIEINKMVNIKNTPKNLPILMLTGSMDPVGDMTKGVKEILKLYKQAGIKDITYKEYKDARHEILHEKINYQVYNDILNWLNKHL